MTGPVTRNTVTPVAFLQAETVLQAKLPAILSLPEGSDTLRLTGRRSRAHLINDPNNDRHERARRSKPDGGTGNPLNSFTILLSGFCPSDFCFPRKKV